MTGVSRSSVSNYLKIYEALAIDIDEALQLSDIVLNDLFIKKRSVTPSKETSTLHPDWVYGSGNNYNSFVRSLSLEVASQSLFWWNEQFPALTLFFCLGIMSKIDEKKEFITTLRVYLGFILAIILSFGAGLTKLYIAENTGLLFYMGMFVIFLSMLGFLKINKTLHREIKNLKDL